MTTRHTVEADDQRVPVARTEQRRGAMYMRAEARRAAELGIATSTPPKVRSTPRRIQLAVFSAVWLLIAAITAVVGLQWAHEDRNSPKRVLLTPAAAQPARMPPAPSKAVPAPTPVPAPNDATVSKLTVAAPTPAATPRPVAVAAVPARTRAAAPRSAIATATAVRRRPVAAAPRLVVTSSPAGAAVTVDGIGWGVTPARIGYLPPGTKRVRVTKDGYASREATIRVGESGTATLNVLLQPAAR